MESSVPEVDPPLSCAAQSAIERAQGATQALVEALKTAAQSVVEGRALEECSASALSGAEKLSQVALQIKSSEHTLAAPAEQVALALRFALLRVSDVSDAVIAFDLKHQVSSRISAILATPLTQAIAAIAEAQALVRNAPSFVANGVATAVAIPAAAFANLSEGILAATQNPSTLLSSRSSRHLQSAYDSMQELRTALTDAMQRGSQQAGSTLAALGSGGVGDAVAYATDELGRVLSMMRQGPQGVGSAAAESLTLARGALQAVIHRLGVVAPPPAPTPSSEGPVDGQAMSDADVSSHSQEEWVQATITTVQESVARAMTAVSRAATDVTQAVSLRVAQTAEQTRANATQAVVAGSQAALGVALTLADRSLTMAVTKAADFAREHHVVERLQGLDKGYGVSVNAVRAVATAQSVAVGIDRRLDVTGKAKDFLSCAAAIDTTVAGGRGAALAGTALTLGTSLAAQSTAYAQGLLSEFNTHRMQQNNSEQSPAPNVLLEPAPVQC